MNKDILCQLQARISKFPMVTTLGNASVYVDTDSCSADIFVTICPMLKMYTDYVTKHEIALDTYAELKKDPKFVEFDNLCQVCYAYSSPLITLV